MSGLKGEGSGITLGVCHISEFFLLWVVGLSNVIGYGRGAFSAQEFCQGLVFFFRLGARW